MERSKNIVEFKLNIIRGKDLLSADLNGKSDPYLVIHKKQPQLVNPPKNDIKTKTVKKTLNPKWNEKYDLSVDLNVNPFLDFEVYDYDFIGKDDPIGKGRIDLKFLDAAKLKKEYYIIIPLKVGSGKNEKFKGEVHFTILPKIRFNQDEWIPLEPSANNIISFEIGWAFEIDHPAEIDISCQAYDNAGKFVAFCSEAKKIQLNGALLLKEKKKERKSCKNIFTFNLSALERSIDTLAIIGIGMDNNSIFFAKEAYLKITDEIGENGKMFYKKDSITHKGLILGLFKKDLYYDRWQFCPLNLNLTASTEEESHAPISQFITSYSQQQYPNDISIDTHPIKNELIMLPENYYSLKEKSIEKIEIGLGWNLKDIGPNVGLAASLIAFQGDEIKLISKGEEFEGIKHLGDSKTPEGAKEMELLLIDFAKIKYNINTVVVIVNAIGAPKIKFNRTGYLRLFDSEGPYCCQLLKSTKESSAFILGVFMKDPDGYWCFQTIIEPIGGNNANESLEQVKNCISKFNMPNGFSNKSPGIPFYSEK